MKKNVATLTIMFAFVACQIWCLSIIFKFPFIGINLVQNERQEWVIEQLDKHSAGDKSDLRPGDVIVKIDGQSPGSVLSVQKWRTIEQATTLDITREGQMQQLSIDIANDKSYDLVPLFEELLSLSMAVFLFIKMGRSPSAQLLALVFLTIAAIYMSLGASVRGDETGKILITSFMTALPVIFFHFLTNFFKEKGNIQLPIGVLKYGYAVAIATFGLRLLYFIPDAPALTYTLFHYNNLVTLSFFIIGFIANIMVLSNVYIKFHKEKSYLSSIIKSLWISLFVSFLPTIFLSFLPQVVTGVQFIDAVYTSWFILFFPLSFAYLIATNQLYDIGLVVRRILFAGIISIVPSGVFTGLNAAIFQNDADFSHILFQFVVLLVLFTFVLYSTEYFTTKLEKFLFPRKYVLNSALEKISKNLGSISSFRELKEIVLMDIVETLQVMGGAIVFKYNDQMEIIREGHIDPAEVEQLLSQSAPPAETSTFTCIEISRHEEYASYLVMTRKKTNTLLGKEDTQWLTLITTYLAVSLENVHLIRKLRMRMQQLASQLPDEDEARDIQWFRKIMFELQEEERMRIATDLHDTTMQDLFFLKRRFVTLMEKYAMNKEDKESLGNIINFVELINMNLRQSCFELHPYLLQEIGLIQTVGKLLDKERYHAPFAIELVTEGAHEIENKDLPTKKHIFRIVQELLNNANKHAEASKVSFRMEIVDGFFCLTYVDNGVGFDMKTSPSKEIGTSGMGMEQIKGRTLLLGGQIQLKSAPGQGVTCKIFIPIGEKTAVS